MKYAKAALSLLLLIGATLIPVESSAEKCTTCHLEQFAFSRFHAPHLVSCDQCHGGNPDADHKETAHLGMEAYPGRMATVETSCGQSQCHADLVPLVKNSIMNTLDGMLSVTREIYNESSAPHQNRTVAERLKHSGADSYLRKLCVSCHLGSERQNHLQSYSDRGGGCSACHLQTYAVKQVPPSLDDTGDITGRGITHPSLTIQIPNDRCFGCHSRSGRISLNYLGLAEVETIDEKRRKDFGYLYDNRLVEQKEADVHHAAGMSCIDCHTASGLMGTGQRVAYLREQNDISCDDCHAPNTESRPIHTLTPRERSYFALYKDKTGLKAGDDILVTQRQKSPLYHLVQEGNRRLMYSKTTGREHEVPLRKNETYHTVSGHERLTCDSCHTAWAPQCYGCHVEFKPEQSQFDHILRTSTPGRWIESRWYVKSELPALGVVEDQKISTFIPGMNLIVQKHPDDEPFEKQIFAATSAHTTQKKGRSCESCHRSDDALGIISRWVAHAENPAWKTPVGWIFENQQTPGPATKPGDRSFNKEEIAKIRQVGVCLRCHQENDGIFQNYAVSLKRQTPQCTDFK